jgi:hypothetical protein
LITPWKGKLIYPQLLLVSRYNNQTVNQPKVTVSIPTGPNLGAESNNGGVAKLSRKAHIVEIWDGAGMRFKQNESGRVRSGFRAARMKLGSR